MSIFSTGQDKASSFLEASIGKLRGLPQGVFGRRPCRLAILVSHPIQYFSPLFKRLAEQPEIDLTVLYCSLQGATPMKDAGFGVSFVWDIPLLAGYRFKELRNYWPGRVAGFFGCTNPGVVYELRRGGYDAAIVFGWGSLTTWLAFGAAKLAGIPWILYGDCADLYEDTKRWAKRQLKHWILGSLFRNTSAFLSIGKHNRRFYQRYGASPKKFSFMPYAVDNYFFHIRSGAARLHRQELRLQYRIPPTAVLVLFVGKLIPRKRPADLLAAFEFLQSSLPNLAIAYAGDGELRPVLEARISDSRLRNARVLGFKNQMALPEIYGMADMLVIPSARENWGLVVNEAMACGLPIITSDKTGAAADIVRNDENGFVYTCGDVGALSQAIQKLATNPDLRRRMGNRSWEIIQHFSYEECIEGVLSALAFVDQQKHLKRKLVHDLP